MSNFLQPLKLVWPLCLILFLGCSKEATVEIEANPSPTPVPIPAPDPTPSSSPNILFIIADDMGKDATYGYSEGNLKPNTPNINTIKSSGITFNNFWVYPTCTPTRASILTGKYGFRTGIKWVDDPLDNSNTILHKYIDQQTNGAYATALIGKWHLSGTETATTNPTTFGMDYFSGLMGGGVPSYTQWELNENGQKTNQTEYITKKFTDLSIDWINNQEKPWFLWLAYTAPHTPFHVPPSEMHSQGNLAEYTQGVNALPYYFAAIEAMDYQIGRLLENIPEGEMANTYIIFIGDNGTPNQVAQTPYSKTTAKGSLYQGGINTPLFISGADTGRNGEIDNNLITGTDLYATIAEMAGIDIVEVNDSKSFKTLLSTASSHRDFQYAEMDNGTDDLWTISNGQYKLFINANSNQEMYDLAVDPYEANNLLNIPLNNTQSEAKTQLENELDRIRN